MLCLKARDRPQLKSMSTVSVALDSTINAFVHESLQSLSLSLDISMKLMMVDIYQSGEVYSPPLPLTRHLKN